MSKSLIGGLRPVHPGEVLREDVLPALGRSKTEIARLLGMSRQSLYDILGERQDLTAKTAIRIGKLCGNGGAIWMALQNAHDLAIAETELRDTINQIPTLEAA